VIANYGWFRYEGTGFNASPVAQSGLQPVYRFFNNSAGGHFYTINAAEKDTVIANYGWFRYEAPVLRLARSAAGHAAVYASSTTTPRGHFYTHQRSRKRIPCCRTTAGSATRASAFYAYPPPVMALKKGYR